MRIAALVSSLVGALAALVMGGVFLLAFERARSSPEFRDTLQMIRDPKVPEQVRGPMRAVLGRSLALPYFLVAAAPLGAIAGLLALERRGLWAGFLLVLALSGPVALLIGHSAALFDLGFRNEPEYARTYFLLLGTGVPCALLASGAVFAFLDQFAVNRVLSS
jgi:hypothetical protein